MYRSRIYLKDDGNLLELAQVFSGRGVIVEDWILYPRNRHRYDVSPPRCGMEFFSQKMSMVMWIQCAQYQMGYDY